MKIVAVYNIKGGVGKTTAAANLSYFAAADNFRTLLCDLDPQGSVSYYFRVRPHRKFDSKKLLNTKSNEKYIRGSDFDNLDLLPADISFRRLDIQLDGQKKHRNKQLRQVFAPLKKSYDLIVLDCPPNITLLSENIFRAANIILVPVTPSTLSMITYKMLIDFFAEKKLDSAKIKPFFSMAERRKKLHRDIMAENTSKHSGVFFNTVIPYNSAVEKMGLYRKPVACFAPRTSGARAYLHLWREFEQYLYRDTGSGNE